MADSLKALPVVKEGEEIEAWLQRAVPVLVEEVGMDQEEATQLATEAWNEVNGTPGEPVPGTGAAEAGREAEAADGAAGAAGGGNGDLPPEFMAHQGKPGHKPQGQDQAEEDERQMTFAAADPEDEIEEEAAEQAEDRAQPVDSETEDFLAAFLRQSGAGEEDEREQPAAEDEQGAEPEDEGEDEDDFVFAAADPEDEIEEKADQQAEDQAEQPAEEPAEGQAATEDAGGEGEPAGEPEDEDDPLAAFGADTATDQTDSAENEPEDEDEDAFAFAAGDPEDEIEEEEEEGLPPEDGAGEDDPLADLSALDAQAGEGAPDMQAAGMGGEDGADDEEDDFLATLGAGDAEWEDPDSWGDEYIDAAGNLAQPEDQPGGDLGAVVDDAIADWFYARVQEFVDSLSRTLADNGLVPEDAIAQLVERVRGSMPDTQKSTKAPTILTQLESELHRHFTEVADGMRAGGYLTRQERIALSSAIGDALATFVQSAKEQVGESALNRSPFVDAEQMLGDNGSTIGESSVSEASGMFEFVTPLPVPGELTKGGPGSGHFGHRGRPGKRGGSLPRSAGIGVGRAPEPDEPADRPWRNEARDLFRRTVEDGGFTYEPLDGSAPTSGLALSIYPDREFSIKVDDLTVEHIEDFIVRNQDLWADPETKLGGWYDTETGIVYLDVSVVVDSHEKAVELCRQYNQEGYYDLGTGQTVIVKAEEERRREVTTKTGWWEPEVSVSWSPCGTQWDQGASELVKAAWMAVKGLPGPIVQRHIERGEPVSDMVAVKSLGRNRVGAYLCLWGDPSRKDIAGEYFTPQTEELTAVFEAIGAVPLLYHHAMDNTMKTLVVGTVDLMEPDDVGLWIEAQIRENEAYQKFIEPLVMRKVLGLSSGTLPGARRVNKSTGEILRWPIVEASMTPTPAEWRMVTQWPVQNIKSAYLRAGLDAGRLDWLVEGEGQRREGLSTQRLIERELELLKVLEL